MLVNVAKKLHLTSNPGCLQLQAGQPYKVILYALNVHRYFVFVSYPMIWFMIMIYYCFCIHVYLACLIVTGIFLTNSLFQVERNYKVVLFYIDIIRDVAFKETVPTVKYVGDFFFKCGKYSWGIYK